MQNALRSNEWERISIYKTLKIEIQKGGTNNSDFLRNWFIPEITSRLFNLYKFQDSVKKTPWSCRMHWNITNDDEFGSIKHLLFKYRWGEQIIQTFFIINSPQKLSLPSFICTNFKTLRKMLLNHADWIDN